MSDADKTREELLEEIARLRARLAEPEETLEAIRGGAVDAVVVSAPAGERVVLLEEADRLFRLIVEEMREGAAVLTPGGDILYGNRRLAEMLRVHPAKLAGASIHGFVGAEAAPLFAALLRVAERGNARAEVALCAADGLPVPTYLALNGLAPEGFPGFCLIATDLSEQQRRRDLMAVENLASSILEQALVALVVCDEAGLVLRANEAAHCLSGGNPILERFETAFPLSAAADEGRPADPRRARRLGAPGDRGPPRARRAELPSAGHRRPLARRRGESPRHHLQPLRRHLGSRRRRRTSAGPSRRRRRRAAPRTASSRRSATRCARRSRPCSRRSRSSSATGDLAAARLRADLAMIRRNVELEARLIDDLLDLARIARGTARARARRAFDLRPGRRARHCRSAARRRSRRGGSPCESRTSPRRRPPGATRRGSPRSSGTSCSNAIKFTPEGGDGRRCAARREPAEGGRATASSSRSPTAASASSPEVLPRVFDAFEQGRARELRRMGGLGLGLAISKTHRRPPRRQAVGGQRRAAARGRPSASSCPAPCRSRRRRALARAAGDRAARSRRGPRPHPPRRGPPGHRRSPGGPAARPRATGSRWPGASPRPSPCDPRGSTSW